MDVIVTKKLEYKILKVCMIWVCVLSCVLASFSLCDKAAYEKEEAKRKEFDEINKSNNLEIERLTILENERLVEVKKYNNIVKYIQENKSERSKIKPELLAKRIIHYSKSFDQDPEFIASLICAESNFYPRARSYADCRGLGQASRETWDWFNSQYVWKKYRVVWDFERDVYDVDKNIQFTCWYVNKLFEYEYIDNTYTMLTAYNCGPHHMNVKRNVKWNYSEKIIKDAFDLITQS